MSKAVIFDLDGTIYYGNSVAFYAQEIVNNLKKEGFEIFFITNNSSKTRQEIFGKLLHLGINAELKRVYTSAYATALYLSSKSIKNVFMIGSEGFKKELELQNIKVTEPSDAEAVVIGMDVHFNYETIAQALLSVQNGAKIIACNVDKNFPIEGGILKPGCNAIVASLLGSCDKKLDTIVGKPNTFLIETIVKNFNLDKNSITVVGDSLQSDIAMANSYGCYSVLVGNDGINLRDAEYIIKERVK